MGIKVCHLFYLKGILKVPLHVIKKKSLPFISSDYESVFAQPLTGKILSFLFYPMAVECKFWISQSAITHIQN